MDHSIYLDHAATTMVHETVFAEMLPFFKESFGNASSQYRLGRRNRNALEESRMRISSVIGCSKDEIFFTSGGSESDNWAIKGVANAKKMVGNHIITTAIEHPAVKNSCASLEREGFELTYLSVDEFGIIDIEELKRAIRPSTILISVMFANNEVGSIQPIESIGKIAALNNITFHVDGVQAAGILDIDVDRYGIDLLSISAHKFYGPKGVGALYIRNGTLINPMIYGGAQESGLRAGTENVAGIVGMAKALEIASEEMEESFEKITNMRKFFEAEVLKGIEGSLINGHPSLRLPGISNISFSGVDNNFLMSSLDMRGIYVSTGSACMCKERTASYVLEAMGKSRDVANNSVRFSFGKENTMEEIEMVLKMLKFEISRIRDQS